LAAGIVFIVRRLAPRRQQKEPRNGYLAIIRPLRKPKPITR